MKQQSCKPIFLKYTILSILGTLGVSCYILADTFFVSKGLGSQGLTALNLAIPIYNFIHGTGLMLGMGGATKFSIYQSQHRKEEMDEIYTNTLYLALIFSAVFVFTGLFFSEHLAKMLGADHYTAGMTVTYLRWLLIFAPAFILNDILLCFVRNDDGPQLSMMAMLIGSFSNIGLDYLFIFPCQMGIFGAVFATGLSPIISMAMMLPHWTKKKNTFHLMRSRMNTLMLKHSMSLGLPSLIAQLSSGAVMIVFNRLILRLEGNIGVAAYGVIANLSLVIVAIYTGIAQGVQPLLSRFYGQNDTKQLQTVQGYAMILMLIVSVILYAASFIFAGPIAAVFNSERQAALQQMAEMGLKLYFISNGFAGYNIILATYFTSIEKARPAQILSVLRGFVVILPLAFLMAAVWKMTGIWLTYPVTEGVVALAGIIVYKRIKRKADAEHMA
ncbi:MAG: MATE family efflux transporter [Lachnospiraceae bacterium]|jgi:putative MATE family efflux protein|nr:MATE family efflux transporter [Lachnospiraceae bacterium]